jgi:hypothetical protein
MQMKMTPGKLQWYVQFYFAIILWQMLKVRYFQPVLVQGEISSNILLFWLGPLISLS